MRGKKPKDREKYFIRLDGDTLVEVNREIYLEWHQSRRKERYQKERDREYGVFSIEKLHEKGYFPEQSLNGDTTLEAVLRNECRNRLENALRKLPEQDIRLVRFLYFDEMTVKKTAEICGCSRKTIQNRRRRILEKMKNLMSEISP
ncbi:sigma-70 family RNA polymerase sigma factor [Lachnospiraceae bacterium 64-25]|jgi:RNA polymerase sigma factor (sigma-70 family)|nr:sigma-70 family RNA polymerase sigma factor [Lachnospiraceae bacterium]